MLKNLFEPKTWYYARSKREINKFDIPYLSWNKKPYVHVIKLNDEGDKIIVRYTYKTVFIDIADASKYLVLDSQEDLVRMDDFYQKGIEDNFQKSVTFEKQEIAIKTEETGLKGLIEKLLVNRDKDERDLAYLILTDKKEYPYKSDIVKAFLKAGFTDDLIFQLMDFNTINRVTLSYIKSIREKNGN